MSSSTAHEPKPSRIPARKAKASTANDTTKPKRSRSRAATLRSRSKTPTAGTRRPASALKTRPSSSAGGPGKLRSKTPGAPLSKAASSRRLAQQPDHSSASRKRDDVKNSGRQGVGSRVKSPRGAGKPVKAIAKDSEHSTPAAAAAVSTVSDAVGDGVAQNTPADPENHEATAASDAPPAADHAAQNFADGEANSATVVTASTLTETKAEKDTTQPAERRSSTFLTKGSGIGAGAHAEKRGSVKRMASSDSVEDASLSPRRAANKVRSATVMGSTTPRGAASPRRAPKHSDVDDTVVETVSEDELMRSLGQGRVATAAGTDRRRAETTPTFRGPARQASKSRLTMDKGASGGDMDKARRQLQQEELDVMSDEAAQWMSDTLEADYTNDQGGIDREKFWLSLQCGADLLRLVLKCIPEDMLSKPGFPKAKVNKAAKPKSFFARDNVANFIAIAKALGLSDVLMFETEDVMSRKQDRRVINTLLQLARIAAKNGSGVAPPLIIQYEMEIDAMMAAAADEPEEEEEDEEDLQEDIIEEVEEEEEKEDAADAAQVDLPPTVEKVPEKPVEPEEAPPSEESKGRSRTGTTSTRRGMVFHKADFLKCRWLPYIPQERNALDEAVALAINMNRIDVRVRRGKRPGEYRVGKPPSVFMRLIRNLVLVRVGGGWQGIVSFARKKLESDTLADAKAREKRRQSNILNRNKGAFDAQTGNIDEVVAQIHMENAATGHVSAYTTAADSDIVVAGRGGAGLPVAGLPGRK